MISSGAERVVHIDEAAGSNPASSTNFRKAKFFFNQNIDRLKHICYDKITFKFRF